jgi:predicted O-methyltransferase YrrM
MTDSATTMTPDAEQAQGRGAIGWIFAVAIFTSASLVFVVQPMVTKLILPMLGGSPAVWNTSMVFFQTALLAGYGYAHGLQRVRSLRAQVMCHLALLLLAALFLPLRVSGLLGDPDPSAPAVWLLATLGLSVGAPFAILSATAPLLQAWYARVRAGQADGANPYVLYAASNLGSFLALLAYPVLIEPLASLSGQRWGWSAGYGLFIALIGLLTLGIWRSHSQAVVDVVEPLPRSAPIAWKEKAILVLLAAAPSSLMLGVTTHLSTDVASAPFLWVIPLALYLLTFVIAFQSKPLIPLNITLMLQAAAGALCLVMAPFRTGDWGQMFIINLLAFFITTLMCHQLLVARRPAPDRLTEFYLLMSLGGVVGGAFTALLAPVIFTGVWEYPLVMVLVALFRPTARGDIGKWAVLLFVGALLLAISPPVISAVFQADWDLAWAFSRTFNMRMEQLTVLILGLVAILAFALRDRPRFFTVILGVIALSGHEIAKGYDAALSERSFFGVLRVSTSNDPRLGGPVHVLTHGTTLHGAQPRAAEFACRPTLYYAPTTPIGETALALRERRRPLNIGVVGLGSGAMAAYKRAEDQLTFFEIDPAVDRIARDPRWFTFISNCAEGPVRTVLGDARLTMARETPGSYDMLLIDAFSSDAVPTHLLTQEALAGYLRLLKPDGVVVLHLSNRNLDITAPAQSAARALGAPFLHKIYGEDPEAPDMAEASTEAMVLSPTRKGLDELRDKPLWDPPAPDAGVRPWTDDYVNLAGAVWRHMRE